MEYAEIMQAVIPSSTSFFKYSVHKKCRGMRGRLTQDNESVYWTYTSHETDATEECLVPEFAKFCYLSDTTGNFKAFSLYTLNVWFNCIGFNCLKVAGPLLGSNSFLSTK